MTSLRLIVVINLSVSKLIRTKTSRIIDINHIVLPASLVHHCNSIVRLIDGRVKTFYSNTNLLETGLKSSFYGRLLDCVTILLNSAASTRHFTFALSFLISDNVYHSLTSNFFENSLKNKLWKDGNGKANGIILFNRNIHN